MFFSKIEQSVIQSLLKSWDQGDSIVSVRMSAAIKAGPAYEWAIQRLAFETLRWMGENPPAIGWSSFRYAGETQMRYAHACLKELTLSTKDWPVQGFQRSAALDLALSMMVHGYQGTLDRVSPSLHIRVERHGGISRKHPEVNEVFQKNASPDFFAEQAH